MIKLFLGTIFCMCLVGFASNTYASLYKKTTCHYNNVYENIDCLDKENARFVDDLNAIYKTIKTEKISVDEALVPNTEYLKNFTESQTAWNQFTKANCQMLNLPYAGLQGGGIGLVNKSCWNEAYRNRVNELNNWMKELQE